MATSPNVAVEPSTAKRAVISGSVTVSKLIDGVGYKIDVSAKQIVKVDVFDVDIVLFTDDQRRIILAGAALEAQQQTPPTVMTTSGAIGLTGLLAQVGEIKVNVPAAIMASTIVVNPNEQDLNKKPVKENPPSEQDKPETEGQAESAASGSVSAKAVDVTTQAVKQAQSASKAAREQVNEQLQDARQENEKTSDASSVSNAIPVVTGVPQVITGNLDGPKITLTSYNVGGVSQTVNGGVTYINAGMGNAQSTVDSAAGAQLQKVALQGTSGDDVIDAMGTFKIQGSQQYLFQRKVSVELVGVQKTDLVEISGVPPDMTIAATQATYDVARNVWVAKLDKVTMSNSGKTSNIDLTFTYNPLTTQPFDITLKVNGNFLGKPFTDYKETFNILPKAINTEADFTIAGKSNVVFFPTNTPGAQIDAGSGNDSISGSFGNDYIDGGAGVDTMLAGPGIELQIGNLSLSKFNFKGYGNDTFVVDSPLDVVVGGNDGTNTIVLKSSGNSGTEFALDNVRLVNINNLVMDDAATASGIIGTNKKNLLQGNNGNNFLKSGVLNIDGGVDTLIGGAGNDTYLANSRDVIVELANGGTDTVMTNATIDLTSMANIENVILTEAGNINATGNEIANFLTGNDGNNGLNGRANKDVAGDTLIGGLGHDTYYLNSNLDVVKEVANQGSDTVVIVDVASVTRQSNNISLATSYANVEHLILNVSSNNSVNLFGTDDNNQLSGNAGNNIFDGGKGADTLIGGGGNDTFIVRDSGTQIQNSGGVSGAEGSIVLSDVNYSLAGTGVNRITLSQNINAILMSGDVGADVMIGNDQNNVIDGGAGTDTMYGGAGNDTYTVDNSSDVVVEGRFGDLTTDAGGDDLVKSSVTYNLNTTASQFVENLELTGINQSSGFGNDKNNLITGNAKDNILFGGNKGKDTLVGGDGNDTYILKAGVAVIEANSAADQIDTAVFLDGASNVLPNNVENGAIFLGSYAFGNGIVEVGVATALSGNSGNNNLTLSVLSGGAGTVPVTLSGGGGDDNYFINNPGMSNDIPTVEIQESANGGRDAVYLSHDRLGMNFTLPNEVENLFLVAGGASTLIGNSLANNITGGGFNDFLMDVANTGLSTAADTLIGGAGNDSYLVTNSGTLVTEIANGGTDTVFTSVNNYVLPINVEELRVNYSALGGISVTGNADSNRIFGHNGNDTLIGGGGSDTFYSSWGSGANVSGVGGQDTYIGGAANDVYFVSNTATVIVSGGGVDSLISNVNYQTANVSYLIAGRADVVSGGITANQAVAVNLTYAGAGGSTLIGNDASNYLSSNLTNSVADYLADNNLASFRANDPSTYGQVINTGAGADTLAGGLGDDTYLVTVDGTRVVDTGGVDTLLVFSSVDASKVSPTSTMEVINFYSTSLQGVSLAGSNATISGGTANTVTDRFINDKSSSGNTLDDGGSAYSLKGGVGNDTYVIRNSNSLVVENDNEGADTLDIRVANFVIPVNVEAVVATAADQTFTIANTNVATITSINMGGGSDELKVTGVPAGSTFNFSSLLSSGQSKLSFVEKVSFQDSTSQTIAIPNDLAGIKDMLSKNSGLTIRRDAGDTFDISAVATTQSAGTLSRSLSSAGGVDTYTFYEGSTSLGTMIVTTA